jgi:hypothetical protein
MCAISCLDIERSRLITLAQHRRGDGEQRGRGTVRRRSPISTDISRAYATSTEFCRAFTDNMDSVHLLSFLLTGDLTKAEECFVSGLADCVTGSPVFRDWARSWARRTTVQNAIRMLTPRKDHSAVADLLHGPVSCSFARTPEAGYAIGGVLRLKDFERFVYVMSVLEKYSDQDCAVLLGCSRQDIGETRMKALVHVAQTEGLRAMAGSGFDPNDHEEEQEREVQTAPSC